MIAGVADTHAALWYVLKNPLLSATARTFIEDAAAAGNDIVLSPISLAEIVYLIEKNRLPVSVYEELTNALADHQYVIEECEKSHGPMFPICPIALSRRRLSISVFP